MLGVCSNTANECLVEAHFTLAFYFSGLPSTVSQSHYFSNNGLDHNLRFSYLADALNQTLLITCCKSFYNKCIQSKLVK